MPFASVVATAVRLSCPPCLLQMTFSQDAVRLRLLRMPIVTVTVDAVCLSRCSCRSPQSWQLPFASVVRLCLLQMTVSPDAVRLRLLRMPIVTVTVDAVCLSRCSCRSPQSWQLPFASVVRLCLLQMTVSPDAVRLRLLQKRPSLRACRPAAAAGLSRGHGLRRGYQVIAHRHVLLFAAWCRTSRACVGLRQ
jgi:hypothetical protein